MNSDMNICACMGVRPGDLYCYCGLISRGLDTSHYKLTQEEKDRLNEALSEMFGWKKVELPLPPEG